MQNIAIGTDQISDMEVKQIDFSKSNGLRNKFRKQVNKILVNTEEILIGIRKRLQLQSLLEILFHLLFLPIIKPSHPLLCVKVFLVNLMITIAFVS